jgi:hypothetical protein
MRYLSGEVGDDIIILVLHLIEHIEH